MPRDVTTNTQLQFGDRERNLIDRAAAATGKSSSEFVLEASLAAAHEVICDQVLVKVDDVTFNDFTEILDTPPCAVGAAKLAAVPKPWAK